MDRKIEKNIQPRPEKTILLLEKRVLQIRFEISLNLIQTESLYLKNTCPDTEK